jgi:hypothetical protein
VERCTKRGAASVRSQFDGHHRGAEHFGGLGVREAILFHELEGEPVARRKSIQLLLNELAERFRMDDFVGSEIEGGEMGEHVGGIALIGRRAAHLRAASAVDHQPARD